MQFTLDILCFAANPIHNTTVLSFSADTPVSLFKLGACQLLLWIIRRLQVSTSYITTLEIMSIIHLIAAFYHQQTDLVFESDFQTIVEGPENRFFMLDLYLSFYILEKKKIIYFKFEELAAKEFFFYTGCEDGS